MLELFRLASRRLMLLPPGGRLSVIEVSDLARLLLACVQVDEISIGGMYEPDDGVEGGWSHKSFGRAIGWALGNKGVTLATPQPQIGSASCRDRVCKTV